MVGLTVDYDVFLISRIYEHRLEGFTTEASILRAIGKQSTTITTAGPFLLSTNLYLFLGSLRVTWFYVQGESCFAKTGSGQQLLRDDKSVERVCVQESSWRSPSPRCC